MECGNSQHELLRTSDELYRRMTETSFGSDDAYWSSLPVHLRNFIRNALPLAGNLAAKGTSPGILPGGVSGAGGQRSMYAMAQNIVSTAGGGLRNLHERPTSVPRYGSCEIPVPGQFFQLEMSTLTSYSC